MNVFIVVRAVTLFDRGDFLNYRPFFPGGASGAMARAAVIFFAFIGFNTMAVMAEEIEDPGRNVPRANLTTFPVCTLI